MSLQTVFEDLEALSASREHSLLHVYESEWELLAATQAPCLSACFHKPHDCQQLPSSEAVSLNLDAFCY